MKVAVVARVECRSEGTAEEQPRAVWLGGVRYSIVATLSDAISASTSAGHPNVRHVVVEVAHGEVLRLQRILPDGDWRVFRE